MIEVIPSIDLMQGKCVRLKQGRFDEQTEYSHDPAELAKLYMQNGFKRLHVVDLEGAKNKKLMHLETLAELRKKTDLVIDYGGGIRSRQDVNEVLIAGADYVTIGSLAIREPESVKSWMVESGAEKFIIAADVRDDKIAVDAWTSGSHLKVDELIRQYLPVGLREILCTDISRDGMLKGVNTELYKRLKETFPQIRIIASGGVTSVDDLRELGQYHVDAAVIGKALYEGKLSLDALREFIPRE
ncbi:MAG: 1-(5-phosphoribosyl)-5-[(5-phosphoribosylamino)methylideneamino]imidazole-4-carboxamide isomerase [Bacteroidales bacterium]